MIGITRGLPSMALIKLLFHTWDVICIELEIWQRSAFDAKCRWGGSQWVDWRGLLLPLLSQIMCLLVFSWTQITNPGNSIMWGDSREHPMILWSALWSSSLYQFKTSTTFNPKLAPTVFYSAFQWLSDQTGRSVLSFFSSTSKAWTKGNLGIQVCLWAAQELQYYEKVSSLSKEVLS